MVTVGVLLFGAFVFGAFAAVIASSRGLPAGLYFVIGFLFPLIGIIAAAVAKPAAAPGWYADPWQSSPWRYWDGHQWTSNVG